MVRPWVRHWARVAVVLAPLLPLLWVVVLPGTVAVQSPTAVDVNAALQPPSRAHLFGTDDTGRDVFARVVHGARVTLGLVAGALALSAVLGGVAGLAAGYYGRAADLLPSRLVDVVLSFPPIVLGVVITGVLGPGAVNLVLALAVVYLPTFFRAARAGAIGEAARPYVEAARSLGAREGAILLRHVLPNVLPLVLLQWVVLFPLALQVEAALGFLGLGVQPPTPDWGASLAQAKDMLLGAPWLSIFPGLAILLSATAVTILGRALQRAPG